MGIISIHSPAPLSALPRPRGPGHPPPSGGSHAFPCRALVSVAALGALPYCRYGLPARSSLEVGGGVAWTWAVAGLWRTNAALDCVVVVLWCLLPALASCALPCRVDGEGGWVGAHGPFFSTSAAEPSGGETRVQRVGARRSVNDSRQAVMQVGTYPLGRLEEHLMGLGIVLLGWLVVVEARGMSTLVM